MDANDESRMRQTGAALLDGDRHTHLDGHGANPCYRDCRDWWVELDLGSVHTLVAVGLENYGDMDHDVTDVALARSNVTGPSATGLADGDLDGWEIFARFGMRVAVAGEQARFFCGFPRPPIANFYPPPKITRASDRPTAPRAIEPRGYSNDYTIN